MASVVAVRVTRGLLMGGTLMFVACWSCLCVGWVGRVGALLGPEGTRVGQVLVTGGGRWCCLGAGSSWYPHQLLGVGGAVAVVSCVV